MTSIRIGSEFVADEVDAFSQHHQKAQMHRTGFPFDTPGVRAQALVHAPAAFRGRGVFVAGYEIDAA